MPAHILDGNVARDEIFSDLRPQIAALAAKGVRPGLTAILSGHNPASEIYVRNKIKACEHLGLSGRTITLPESTTTDEILEAVGTLNGDDETDGILIQLPLPAQVDARRVQAAVDPAKDVDGFHPYNLGCLLTQRPGLVPCTPAGILQILKRNGIPVAGRRAVVIGRSDIVGKPLALLLLHENATVTICHSKTRDLAVVARDADILVAAIGRAAMVTREFIRPGAVVIDVGINKLQKASDVERIFPGDPARTGQFRQRGSVLVGDVHPVDAAECAGFYTPVPGGVGPLTIAMLMSNTVKAARQRRFARAGSV